MSRNPRLAFLVLLLAFGFAHSTPVKYRANDGGDCSLKTLSLNELFGEWKLEKSKNPPSEKIVMKWSSDGKNALKISISGKDFAKYGQPNAEQPGKFSSQLKFPSGEVLNLPMEILAMDPKRYLVTYMRLNDKFEDFGVYLRPNVQKLEAKENSAVAKALKCVGVN